MWGVLKNVTALATEGAQNLTSQATQLLEKLDGGMNQDNDEQDDNEEGGEEAGVVDDSENEVPEKPEVQQVIGVDGETFFVTKTPTKKKPKAKIAHEVNENESSDNNQHNSSNKEHSKESHATHKTSQQEKNVDPDSLSVASLLEEEVKALKSLISELTGKMDIMHSKHASELEVKEMAVADAHKQLSEAHKKVEVLEKQTNILQLQSNLKEIKDTRVSTDIALLVYS